MAAQPNKRLSAHRCTRVADSIARVREDSLAKVRQDSIDSVMFAEPISVIQGKLGRTQYQYSESWHSKMPLTVTNNTDINFSPDDYTISYTALCPQCSDGSLPLAAVKGTVNGIGLVPGAQGTITIEIDNAEKSRRSR